MAAKPTIKYKLDDSKLKKIVKELSKFGKGWVLVGLQEGEEYIDSSTTVALIGFWNEFGTSDKLGGVRIPERSWMRSWFDSNRKQINKIFIQMTNLIKQGRINAETALKRIGAWAVGELKRSIRDLQNPPNAFSTIRMKKSSSPLIDTGQMMNSINYKIGFGTPPERQGGIL